MLRLPYPMGRIPGVRFPAVPFCWRWLPPGPADWERARVNRWGPVTDPELIAFGVLVGWCRYRCSICGASDPDYRIVMDHDHKTGMCRGLLCLDCNRTEGFGGGKAWDLYRKCPPALICGVTVYYWPASTLPASPEILEFQEDLSRSRRRVMRRRQPWFASEDRIASDRDGPHGGHAAASMIIRPMCSATWGTTALPSPRSRSTRAGTPSATRPTSGSALQ